VVAAAGTSFRTTEAEIRRAIQQAGYQPASVYGHGHGEYYRNVIAVLRGQARPHLDGRGGRKSLELILAIYKSARDGRRVALPLV